jgi:hypothetical protein
LLLAQNFETIGALLFLKLLDLLLQWLDLGLVTILDGVDLVLLLRGQAQLAIVLGQ